jgi:hypothetical protein
MGIIGKYWEAYKTVFSEFYFFYWQLILVNKIPKVDNIHNLYSFPKKIMINCKDWDYIINNSGEDIMKYEKTFKNSALKLILPINIHSQFNTQIF